MTLGKYLALLQRRKHKVIWYSASSNGLLELLYLSCLKTVAEPSNMNNYRGESITSYEKQDLMRFFKDVVVSSILGFWPVLVWTTIIALNGLINDSLKTMFPYHIDVSVNWGAYPLRKLIHVWQHCQAIKCISAYLLAVQKFVVIHIIWHECGTPSSVPPVTTPTRNARFGVFVSLRRNYFIVLTGSKWRLASSLLRFFVLESCEDGRFFFKIWWMFHKSFVIARRLVIL